MTLQHARGLQDLGVISGQISSARLGLRQDPYGGAVGGTRLQTSAALEVGDTLTAETGRYRVLSVTPTLTNRVAAELSKEL